MVKDLIIIIMCVTLYNHVMILKVAHHYLALKFNSDSFSMFTHK